MAGQFHALTYASISSPLRYPDGAVGDANANTLNGSFGSETIDGNGGKDILSGGASNDTLVFDTAAEAKGDTIVDFVHNVDRIDLSGIDANTKVAGDQGVCFIGIERFHNVAGELHAYRLSDGNTYVSGDTKGHGVAEFAIKLSGKHTFTNADFVL